MKKRPVCLLKSVVEEEKDGAVDVEGVFLRTKREFGVEYV
jgi:hypothetical protein